MPSPSKQLDSVSGARSQVLSGGVGRRSFLLGSAAVLGGLFVPTSEDGPASAAPVPAIESVIPMPKPWRLDSELRWIPNGSVSRMTDASLRTAFRSVVRCGAGTLHVAGSGDDQNSGARARPLREISTAVHRASPGTLIVVGDGTYGYTEIRNVQGRPDAWLGIMTESPATRAVVTVPPPTDNFFNVIGSCFVGVYGLEIVGDQHNSNTNCSGISVYGDSHHVLLWRNQVHDFPGGGINCFDVGGSHDLIDISYNRIYDTSKYSPNNTSGISVYASRDLTGGATLPGGFGYRIVNNWVSNVECLVPYTPGGYDFVTDGNAISLDCIESTYGYRKPVLVAGNLLTGCGGRAVLAYNTVNVTAAENTAVGNLRTRSPAISGGCDLEGKTDRSVRFLGNVICPLHTDRSTDSHSAYQRNVILGGSQTVPPDNVDRRHTGLTFFRGGKSLATSNAGPAAYTARTSR